MGKNNHEVNGVLVYRRWCPGAILSTLFLLIIIAVPVAAIAYNWLVINVPDTSVASTATLYNVAGLDLVKNVFKTDTELSIQQLINDIGGATTVKYFTLIMKYSLYGMFGFLALIALFGAIELIFFIFYLFTGRVISPSAPVKIAWVLFALSLIYALLSFGLAYFISLAYAGAQGGSVNFLPFLIAGIMPKVDQGNFVVNFFWPLLYMGVSLIGAILLSIVYGAAFKDKFFIGRAKRFGSGEMGGNVGGNTYETTHIYTPGGYATASGPSNQPQVIVVNSTPMPNGNGTIIQTVPGGQPIVQQPMSQPVQGQPSEQEAVPSATLPQDIKSIGGHAYSKNLDLKYADIPEGIKELGVAAFANCLNLEVVTLPKSVRRIKKNCFFNCAKLVRINYAGTKEEWRYVARGSNWLDRAGTKTVVCSDGAIIVDPHR